MKKRILTGDRPTGNLHLGHYFGSLVTRLKCQDEYDQMIMIADLQALTDNFDNPSKVKENVMELMLDYLSVGLDPKKTSFLLQSKVPELAELTVLFSNLVTVNRLQRIPTIKAEIADKKEIFGKDGESVPYGYLGHPVSQAADIFLVKADVVPVGEDQMPLVEVSNEIIRKFNRIYCPKNPIFKDTEGLLSPNPRIKGLDGNSKMSKSLGNTINLIDTDAEIKEKVMKAITDPMKIKKDDPGHPDGCMVAYYYKLIKPEEYYKMESECKSGDRGCVACKQRLTENIINFLEPIRERRKFYEENPELVDKLLKDGTSKYRNIGQETMREVKKALLLEE